MRSAKFLTADLVYIYCPNLHVTDRRIAITESLIGILLHDNIQGFHLLVENPLRKRPFPKRSRSSNAYGSYKLPPGCWKTKAWSILKRNTDFRITFQYRDASSILRRV